VVIRLFLRVFGVWVWGWCVWVCKGSSRVNILAVYLPLASQ